MALLPACSPLHSDDGTDVRTVDADNAVFHPPFSEQVRFAGDTLLLMRQTLALL